MAYVASRRPKSKSVTDSVTDGRTSVSTNGWTNGRMDEWTHAFTVSLSRLKKVQTLQNLWAVKKSLITACNSAITRPIYQDSP